MSRRHLFLSLIVALSQDLFWFLVSHVAGKESIVGRVSSCVVSVYLILLLDQVL